MPVGGRVLVAVPGQDRRRRRPARRPRGPSTSGKPWPRLTEAVATARADISPKIELPRPCEAAVEQRSCHQIKAIRIVGGMRIALCQIPVSPDPVVNLARVRDGARRGGERRRVDLAVFPEATHGRGSAPTCGRRRSRWTGRSARRLAAACASAGVAAVVGVFEPAPDGRVYNTAVAFSAAGVTGGRRTGSCTCSTRSGSASRSWSRRVLTLSSTALGGRARRAADLLRHPVPRADPRAGGRRRVAGHGQRRLAGGPVQRGALGDAAARPRDREHRVGRRRRAGARSRREADPRADRGRAGPCSSTRSAWSGADLGPVAGRARGRTPTCRSWSRSGRRCRRSPTAAKTSSAASHL